MGNSPQKPQNFVAQTHSEWDGQMATLLRRTPTTIRTVELPPGVSLDDPRLAQGVVTSEKRYSLDVGQFPEFQAETFEADVDGKLMAKLQRPNVATHFAVYPDELSASLEESCGRCNLHEAGNPALFTSGGQQPQRIAVGDVPEHLEKFDKRRASQVSTAPTETAATV